MVRPAASHKLFHVKRLTPPFIHLRAKSAYSLAEGAIRVKDLVKLSAGLDMPAVALTDRGNLFGALEFAVTA